MTSAREGTQYTSPQLASVPDGTMLGAQVLQAVDQSSPSLFLSARPVEFCGATPWRHRPAPSNNALSNFVSFLLGFGGCVNL